MAALRELEPAELFISGPARAGFPPGVPLLADETPGLGPLSGIAAALGTMRSPLLAVLAVDLPRMTADYLRGLLAASVAVSPPQGMIPQTNNGYFEPLAAVYPRTALAIAGALLLGEDRSLQTFARRLIADHHARAQPVTVAEISLFTNWNQPTHLAQ